MLTLMLLRHAKSSWADDGLHDFDRPLAKRGIAAAPRVGRYLATHYRLPDLIVSSTSLRTRETLALLLAALPEPVPQVIYEDGLYLAGADDLLERIAAFGKGAERIMLVGHNPGMHELAILLAGKGDAAARAALAEKFPTAGLAVITFSATSWSEVRPGNGTLVDFVTPRSLGEG